MEQIKFYIHTGIGKTGSTAIQENFSDQRSLLLSKGILYTGDYLQYISEQPLTLGTLTLHDMEKDPRDCAECKKQSQCIDYILSYLKGIYDRARAGQVKKIVWSNESLHNFGVFAPAFARAEKWFDIKTIIYLRRQDHWFQSAYKQWGIKHKCYAGALLNFDEWYEKNRKVGDYYELTKKWFHALGNDRFSIRIYEKPALVQGVLPDFLAAIDESGLLDDMPLFGKRVNLSLNRDLLQLVKAYHSLFENEKTTEDINALFKNNLAREERESVIGELPFLSGEKRRQIISAYERSNAKTAKEFLGKKDGVLFKEALPDIDAPYKKLDELSPESTARIMMQILISFEKRLSALENR
jgi:hypothetical protein